MKKKKSLFSPRLYKSYLKQFWTLLARSLTLSMVLWAVGCGGGSDDGTGGVVAPFAPGQFAPGGCGSLVAPIGFSSVPGSQIYIDSASVVAGQLLYPFPSGYSYGLPPSTQWGQLAIGNGDVGGQYFGNSSFGTLKVGIQNYGGYGGYPNNGYGGNYNSSVQGSVLLNQNGVNIIMAQLGYGGGYGGGYPNGGYNNGYNVCVNQMGIDLGYSVTTGHVYGNVYLYISGKPFTITFN